MSHPPVSAALLRGPSLVRRTGGLLVVGHPTETNQALVAAARRLGLRARIVHPRDAERQASADDTVLGRLDVLPTVDGVEPGMAALGSVERRGARLLNGPGALLVAHDKLATALRLHRALLPHPRTIHVGEESLAELQIGAPCVVKPRFGSWGKDVALCRTREELDALLAELQRTVWFSEQGALVQELVEPTGYDLRVLVAVGEVVGVARRLAAPGEWRTNVALGGRSVPTELPPDAAELAIAAVEACGCDLAGVDLLPDGRGGWVILEVNGAIDFHPHYSLDSSDVFETVVERLVTADVEELDADRRPAIAAAGR